MLLYKFLRLNYISNIIDFIHELIIHVGFLDVAKHLVSHILNIRHHLIHVFFVIVIYEIVLWQPMDQAVWTSSLGVIFGTRLLLLHGLAGLLLNSAASGLELFRL